MAILVSTYMESYRHQGKVLQLKEVFRQNIKNARKSCGLSAHTPLFHVS